MNFITGGVCAAKGFLANGIHCGIRKNKTKVEKKLKKGAFETFEAVEAFEPEDNYDVVRSKSINLKPQSVDEAILQMNLLGHQFFVFVNSDTEKTNVIYKRRENDYGLLVPED